MLDIDAVAVAVTALGSDVVMAQEIQRRQANALARALGWPPPVWAFKHWPVVTGAEGLAVLARAGLATLESWRISRWAPPWSFRRRVALSTAVDDASVGVQFVDVHLGSDVTPLQRLDELEAVLARVDDPSRTVIAGDLNASRPDEPALRRLVAAGFRDAFPDCGPTNWPGARNIAPHHRLDYVYVGEQVGVVAASVPRYGDTGFERYPPLSDHLPVTVTLDRPGDRDQVV